MCDAAEVRDEPLVLSAAQHDLSSKPNTIAGIGRYFRVNRTLKPTLPLHLFLKLGNTINFACFKLLVSSQFF